MPTTASIKTINPTINNIEYGFAKLAVHPKTATRFGGKIRLSFLL
jgi:hypothetical protein